jgi:hypothetical protein
MAISAGERRSILGGGIEARLAGAGVQDRFLVWPTTSVAMSIDWVLIARRRLPGSNSQGVRMAVWFAPSVICYSFSDVPWPFGPRDPVEGGEGGEAELTSVWDEATQVGGKVEPENGSSGTTLECSRKVRCSTGKRGRRQSGIYGGATK